MAHQIAAWVMFFMMATPTVSATTSVSVPERLPWPQPTHIVFIADEAPEGEAPLTVVVSWQRAFRGESSAGQAHIAVRVIRPERVEGRLYPLLDGDTRALSHDPPAGRFVSLAAGVKVQNDGDGGVVLTAANIGRWQKASTALPARVGQDVPIVVEPTTMRLWIRGPSAFSMPAPTVASAMLLGSHTSTAGHAVLVSNVEDDTAVLLDEAMTPLVVSAPKSTPAFFVDTEEGCDDVLPRALVLTTPDPERAAPKLVRLLSTQGVACDVRSAVVTVRGSVVRGGQNEAVRGVWVQHLR